MDTIDMLLYCPKCDFQHIDMPEGKESKWTNPPHRSHLCKRCGYIWRPCDLATNGVSRLDTNGRDDMTPNPRLARNA